MSETAPQRLSGTAKALVDYGPLGVFLLAYFMGDRLAGLASAVTGRDFAVSEGEEMYLAIMLFMPAFAIAFGYSVWKERRLAPMLVISGLIIAVFGTLTLVLKDKTFFYMKPTLVNLIFAGLLGGGLATGRLFLKSLFDEAFSMPDRAWRTLTIRFTIFFIAMAILNEGAWRTLTSGCDLRGTAACDGEATWVNLKIFGFTLLSLIFTATQLPFIMKHADEK